MELAAYTLASFASFFITILCFRPRRSSVPFVMVLHVYHFVNTWVFSVYSRGQPTDSENYSIWASQGWMQLSAGTPSVVNLVRAIGQLGISQYGMQMLVFSALSSIGIAAAYIALTKHTEYRRCERKFHLVIMLAFLLPGLHFWTGPIGKDAVIMFACGILVWSLLAQAGRSIFLPLLAVALVFVMRPHVGLCLTLALVSSIYLKSIYGRRASQRGFLTTIYALFAAGMLVAFYLFFLAYIQKYSADGFQDVGEFVSSRGAVYADTGSGFDSSAYPYLVRMLLFVIGGVPWSISGFAELAAILEGVVIGLCLLLGITRAVRSKWRYSGSYNDTLLAGAVVFVVLAIAVLTVGATNFGLIARQRVMIYIPVLTVYMLGSSLFWASMSSRSAFGARSDARPMGQS